MTRSKKDRFNQYNIIHKSTGLYWEGMIRSDVIDYNAVFWKNETKFLTASFYPKELAFSYDSGRFFDNIASLLFNILQFFVNPQHYKRKGLEFNTLKYFLDNFDIIHHKTKVSAINEKFLKTLLRAYLKDKVNDYAHAFGNREAAYSTNKIVYANLLNIKYGIIFKTKIQAKEYHKRFVDSDIAGNHELHLNGIFFQDSEMFTLCKLISPNTATIINFDPIVKVLVKLNKEFEDEFLNKSAFKI